MIEKLTAALHDELGDVTKYMLMYAQACDKIAPEILSIADDELRHALMIIDMIHEMGGEISDADMKTASYAEAITAKK